MSFLWLFEIFFEMLATMLGMKEGPRREQDEPPNTGQTPSSCSDEGSPVNTTPPRPAIGTSSTNLPSQSQSVQFNNQDRLLNAAAAPPPTYATPSPNVPSYSQGGHPNHDGGFISTVLSNPSHETSWLNVSTKVQYAQQTNPPYTTVIAGESDAMKILRSHSDPSAAVDSSARQPPPTCHPKTRLEVRRKLASLVNDEKRKFMMGWLFGAAGTGKSAVGQTFATDCQDAGRLGAAFFFSRPNGRNKYTAVIPTLVCQLATHCLPYRPALVARMVCDPYILDKAAAVQLKKLINEPLMEVRLQLTTTYLILLDGVDECGENTDPHEREREQCELVEMIGDTVRDYPDLPLFWLLCSRPEEHLQDAFAVLTTTCHREELVIDDQCRQEVEQVLREGFTKITKKRRIIPLGPDGWPPEDEFTVVERAVAGLHVFGAAILKDIEYSDFPVEQLRSLIPILERVAGSGTMRSIAHMDLFYTHILNDVPVDRLPTTLWIIGAIIAMPDRDELSAQALCNFLCLDPNIFFSALRKLHSVINIPSPENAHGAKLQFYHASFSDFVTDPSRSAKYFINKQTVLIEIIKLCFHWHQLHSNLFHSSDQPLNEYHKVAHDHDPIPALHLAWIASPNHLDVSQKISTYAAVHCFNLFGWISNCDGSELLALLQNLDLSHMSFYKNPLFIFEFFSWVYKQDPSSGFIRMVPESAEDWELVSYLESLVGEPVTPARDPLDWVTWERNFREYILVGRKSLSIIVCYTNTGITADMTALNLDGRPDESAIEQFQSSEASKQWHEYQKRRKAEVQHDADLLRVLVQPQ